MVGTAQARLAQPTFLPVDPDLTRGPRECQQRPIERGRDPVSLAGRDDGARQRVDFQRPSLPFGRNTSTSRHRREQRCNRPMTCSASSAAKVGAIGVRYCDGFRQQRVAEGLNVVTEEHSVALQASARRSDWRAALSSSFRHASVLKSELRRTRSEVPSNRRANARPSVHRRPRRNHTRQCAGAGPGPAPAARHCNRRWSEPPSAGPT